MMARLCREPLLQFMVLGALIFAADALLNDGADEQRGDIYRIRVTSQHMDAQRAAFRTEQGRMPSDAELQARLERWLEEQMLYRQALALGLEEKDAIVQRQLVRKMRFLIEDALPVEAPDETALQAWLQKHPERYGHGPTLSFQQVFISRGAHGGQSAQVAESLLARLRANPAQDYQSLGNYAVMGSHIENADFERLRRDFGQDFAEAIQALPSGEWQGPVRSGLGLHLVKVTARSEFAAARLADVRDRVSSDLRLHLRREANEKAMQRLRERFHIEYEIPPASGTGG